MIKVLSANTFRFTGNKLPKTFAAQAKFMAIKSKLKGFMSGEKVAGFPPEISSIKYKMVYEPKKSQAVFNFVLRCPITDKGSHFTMAVRFSDFLGLNHIIGSQWKDRVIENGKFFESTFPVVLHMQYTSGNDPNYPKLFQDRS
jgi:hypothetical protein